MADFTGNKKEALDENDFRVLGIKEKIMAYSAGFVPPEGKNEQEALNELRFLMNDNAPRRKIVLKPWIMAVAATVTALVLLFPAIRLIEKKVVIARMAEQKEILLPDGSSVTLNAGSKFSYSGRNFQSHRAVRLEGEAFLKVQKGNEFVISTPHGDVEILGTELNIFSRGNEFRVSCITGKVGVNAGTRKVILTPGELAELSGEILIKKSVQNPAIAVSWKQGEFYFEDKALIYIFDELERQFNVTIKHQGLENRFFTGNFSNKNLKEALDIVCIPMELNYEVMERNKVVTVSPK